jgi:hypothetical protein
LDKSRLKLRRFEQAKYPGGQTGHSPFIAPVHTPSRGLNARPFYGCEPLVSITYAVVESFVIKGYGPLTRFANLVYACVQDLVAGKMAVLYG